MQSNPWKSYTFLILSVVVTLTLIAFFFIGFGFGNQDVLETVWILIIVLGIASILMAIWSFASKLARRKSTIAASIITLLNVLLFAFLF